MGNAGQRLNGAIAPTKVQGIPGLDLAFANNAIPRPINANAARASECRVVQYLKALDGFDCNANVIGLVYQVAEDSGAVC